jgi:hypothetical protein
MMMVCDTGCLDDMAGYDGEEQPGESGFANDD